MQKYAGVTISCHGHPHITALHPSTLEITREPAVTLRGDCIVGVGAVRGARDLPPDVRDLLCRDEARVTACFRCRGLTVVLHGHGSRKMTLSDPSDMVFRRSHFVCGRTVAIGTDLTARLFPRDFVEELRRGHPMTVEISVFVP
ncbi:MAG: DUF371 domain-containing protein [Methanolinea sp.]|nr:DUF371 domain-containing protein [Methanolinea sp.]